MKSPELPKMFKSELQPNGLAAWYIYSKHRASHVLDHILKVACIGQFDVEIKEGQSWQYIHLFCSFDFFSKAFLTRWRSEVALFCSFSLSIFAWDGSIYDNVSLKLLIFAKVAFIWGIILDLLPLLLFQLLLHLRHPHSSGGVQLRYTPFGNRPGADPWSIISMYV